jgi:hypothetical protein
MTLNPPEYDIDTAYERVKDASLNDLSRLIPRWGWAAVTILPAAVSFWCCARRVILTR